MNDPPPCEGDGFVLYGSLMRGLDGRERSGIGEGLRYVGPCIVLGELYDLGHYPGLLPGSDRIVAELHALRDASIVHLLDAFEGFEPAAPNESLYLRERVSLVDPPNTRAWIYFYNERPDASMRIPSGDWRGHLDRRDGPSRP